MFADQLHDISTECQDWSLAACRDGVGLTELFFSDHIPDINAAKALCAGCPLLEACLRGAILRQEPGGVWGGQLFVNGRILAQKRRRGRPPKLRVPEPEVVLPASIVALLSELDGQEAQSA